MCVKNDDIFILFLKWKYKTTKSVEIFTVAPCILKIH
jgi:hypothetical protein